VSPREKTLVRVPEHSDLGLRNTQACRAICQASAQLVVGGIVQELLASETQVKPFERSLRLGCCRSLP